MKCEIKRYLLETKEVKSQQDIFMHSLASTGKTTKQFGLIFMHSLASSHIKIQTDSQMILI